MTEDHPCMGGSTGRPSVALKLYLKIKILRLLAPMAAYFLRRPIPTALKRAVWSYIARPLSWRGEVLQAWLPGQIKMNCQLSDLVQGTIYWFGTWEPNISAYIAHALRPGDIFIDVGANVGWYTLLAAKLVGKSGRVHAIEASPSIAAALESNLQLSGLSESVTVHRVAIAGRDGTACVYLTPAWNLGMTTIYSDVATARGGQLEAVVPMSPLHRVIPAEDLLRARIIKIDVEGGEWEILGALMPLLPGLSPKLEIILEVTEDIAKAHGGSLDAIIGEMKKYGFDAFLFDNEYSAEWHINRNDQSVPPQPVESARPARADILLRRI